MPSVRTALSVSGIEPSILAAVTLNERCVVLAFDGPNDWVSQVPVSSHTVTEPISELIEISAVAWTHFASHEAQLLPTIDSPTATAPSMFA